MTTLYNKVVRRKKDYFITHHVAGDLSHSYEVRAPDMQEPGWFHGSGIPAKDLKDAEKAGKLIEKHGYSKAYDKWEKDVLKPTGYNFGYLPESSKLCKDCAPYAYGEYAEKIRKKHHLERED